MAERGQSKRDETVRGSFKWWYALKERGGTNGSDGNKICCPLSGGKFQELSKLPFPDRFLLIIDSNCSFFGKDRIVFSFYDYG